MTPEQQPTAAAMRAAEACCHSLARKPSAATLYVFAIAIDIEIRPLVEVLEAGMRTADFERHPFRPWHAQARAALAKALLT